MAKGDLRTDFWHGSLPEYGRQVEALAQGANGSRESPLFDGNPRSQGGDASTRSSQTAPSALAQRWHNEMASFRH